MRGILSCGQVVQRRVLFRGGYWLHDGIA